MGYARNCLLYTSKLYDFAVTLIKKGLAYVDDLSAEEIKAYRGTLTEPGKESPYRNRSVEENLDLFARMKAGEFADGTKVLRAKIDMASPNLVMRDTVIYRIAHVKHHRTGDKWCIYPMYDFAHPLSDAIEGITHSVCTLEFEEHRPFYDWLLDSLDFDPNTRPRQIEFARLNLTNTVTSKRKLRQLVEEGYVRGWDDPVSYTHLDVYKRQMQKCQANPLLVVTGGIHMHTIRVPDEDALKAIEHDLRDLGILVDESDHAGEN